MEENSTTLAAKLSELTVSAAKAKTTAEYAVKGKSKSYCSWKIKGKRNT